VGRAGQSLADASEASCFFHPQKKAACTCETCGRFLCDLCDLDFGGQHICPSCLAAGRKKGVLKQYDQFRLSWSGVALLIALVPPIAFIGFTPGNLMFGMVAVVIALIGLKKPRSLTGRRRIVSFTLAIVLGVGETVALIWFGGKLAKTFYGV
jgi:hypothetical protein